MATRSHTRSIDLPTSPERVFALLVTPSAVRGWWGAARAIIVPEPGGTWAAAWGDEDAPDYISIFRIREYDPPRRIVFADGVYRAKTGPLPFEAAFVTTFTVAPAAGGSRLTVVQEGFPADHVADDFYAACEKGWHDTFDGIRRYLAASDGR